LEKLAVIFPVGEEASFIIGLKTPKLAPAEHAQKDHLMIYLFTTRTSSMKELEIWYYDYYYGSLLCLHSQLALGEERFTNTGTFTFLSE
jgi:hypothetical protein